MNSSGTDVPSSLGCLTSRLRQKRTHHRMNGIALYRLSGLMMKRLEQCQQKQESAHEVACVDISPKLQLSAASSQFSIGIGSRYDAVHLCFSPPGTALDLDPPRLARSPSRAVDFTVPTLSAHPPSPEMPFSRFPPVMASPVNHNHSGLLIRRAAKGSAAKNGLGEFRVKPAQEKEHSTQA